MKKHCLIIILVFCSLSFVFGKELPFFFRVQQGLPTTPTSGSPSTLTTFVIATSPLTGDFTDYSTSNTITVGFDNNKAPNSAAYSVEVKLKIQYYNVGNGLAQTDDNVVFTIYYDKKISNKAQSSYRLKTGYYKTSFEILSIKVNSNNAALPSNVYIEGRTTIDRRYNFENNITSNSDEVINNVATTLDTDCDGRNDELNISWQDIVDGPEYYELEWTYANDYGTTLPAYLSNPPYNFKNNSTRVQIYGSSYKIPLTYDHGYIVYRVRGVGYASSNIDELLYGEWNVSEAGNISGVAAASKFHVQDELEVDKNWQFIESFSENGKRKDVLNIYDGTSRSRQMTTKVESDQNLIVGKSYYDYHGREVIKSLPTPIYVSAGGCTGSNVRSSFKYYPKLNKVGSAEFSKTHFDLDVGCEIQGSAMSDASGNSKYYSDQNPYTNTSVPHGPQKFVSDANGYPYSQVEYSADQTGKVRRQGGVGEKFQLGSGHETKFYYGMPNQVQLFRLFGSEVGNSARYKKTVQIDPHGQTSTTYYDQFGRTIATSLAGDNPDVSAQKVFLSPLPSEANSLAEFTIDLFSENSSAESISNVVNFEENQIEFQSSYLVSYQSDQQFQYSFNVDTVKVPCVTENICFDCVYDLRIDIRDECGDILYRIPSDTNLDFETVGRFQLVGGIPQFTLDCPSPPLTTQFSPAAFTIPSMPAGNYTINKVLRINEAAYNFYLDAYLTSTSSCVSTLQDFIDEAVSEIDYSGCEITCEDCRNALGERDEFVTSNQGTYEEFDQLLAECNAPCIVMTECDIRYQMLLTDVSPAGQYGGIYGDDVISAATFPLSVYNAGNLLSPLYYSGGTHDWRTPHYVSPDGEIRDYYFDAYGNESFVFVTPISGGFSPAVVSPTNVFELPGLPGQYIRPQHLLNLSDFLAGESSWYQSLVYLHPEYCYYRACLNLDHQYGSETDSPSSSGFDYKLQNTLTFADAITAGFIKSNYLSLPLNDRLTNWFLESSAVFDPFVTHSSDFENFGAALQSKFQNYQGSYSMFEFAAYLTRCADVSILPGASCYDFGSNYTLSDPIENDAIRDQEWLTLVQLYLGEKQKYSMYFMHEDVLSDCGGGVNFCIGIEDYDPTTSGILSLVPAGSINSSPYFNSDVPCSFNNAELYAVKDKRFGLATDYDLPDENEMSETLYNTTGECPNAAALRALLSELINQGELTSSYTALADYQTMGLLYYNINNGVSSTVMPSFSWQASVNGNTLTANINGGAGNTYCVNIDLTGTPITAFSQITQIYNIAAISNYPPYTMTLVVGYDLGAGPQTTEIPGSTCINIKTCYFEETCELNSFGNDLFVLMNALAQNNVLTSTNLSLDPTYSSLVTSVIRQPIQCNVGLAKWSFNSNQPSFILLKNGTINAFLIKFFNIPASSFAITKSFQNLVSTGGNTFEIDLYNAQGQFIETATGSILLYTNDIQPLPLGDCNSATPTHCISDEHKLTKNLKDAIGFLLLNYVYNTYSTFQSNIFYTPLITSFLPSGNLPLEALNSQTSAYEKIYFRHDECGIELTHNFSGGPSGPNISNITSINGYTLTGQPDDDGYYYQMDIECTFFLNGQTYVETVKFKSCMPLIDCPDCPDLYLPEGGLLAASSGGEVGEFMDEEVEGVGQDDNVDDSVLEEENDSTFTYVAFEKYLEYFSRLQLLDSVYNLALDTAYLQNFAEYYKAGIWKVEKVDNFLNNFRPEIDSAYYLMRPNEYVSNNGPVTNAMEEYSRYSKILNYSSAGVEMGMSPLDTMVFLHGLYADITQEYIDYLSNSVNFEMQSADGSESSEIENIEAVGSLMNIDTWNAQNSFYATESSSFDLQESCLTLYNDYVDAYHWFVNYQSIYNTCPGSLQTVKLYSFAAINAAFYCCSEDRLNEFAEYIASLYSLDNCPGALPLYNGCNQSQMSDPYCVSIYAQYIALIDQYNASYYATQNGFYIPYIYNSAEAFIASGKCECYDRYETFLNYYIFWSGGGALDPVETIDSWDLCEVTTTINGDCFDSYVEYYELTAIYTSYAYSNGYAIVPPLPLNEFLQFCECFNLWKAYIISCLDGLVIPQASSLSLKTICSHVVPPVPCHETTTFIPPIYPPVDPEDPCAEDLVNIATSNATIEYNEYIDGIINDFAIRYRNKCLGTNEDMSVTYDDKEYHFTLYYYDQATNLVKTVPPEGVKPLQITSYADPLYQSIQSDLANGTHYEFTNHQLASRYEYNSLNQLVRQSVPDHDKMDIWEITKPEYLRTDISSITDIKTLSNSKGYLSGNYTAPNGLNRGLLYGTDDGGNTWTRKKNVIGDNLNSIIMEGNKAIAVGDNGNIIQSTDNGQSWDQRLTNPIYTFKNLVDVCFKDGTADFFFIDEQGKPYRSLTGQSSYDACIIQGTQPSNLKFTSIERYGSNYWAAGTAVESGHDIGVLYKWTTNNNWAREINKFVGPDYTGLSITASNKAIVTGPNGRVNEVVMSSSVPNKIFPHKISQEINMGKTVFRNATHGIGLAANGQLHKTENGGETWTAMGEGIMILNSLYKYSTGTGELKVAGCGLNKVYDIRIATDNSISTEAVNISSYPNNYSAVWAREVSGKTYMMLGTSNGKIVWTKDIFAPGGIFWVEAMNSGYTNGLYVTHIEAGAFPNASVGSNPAQYEIVALVRNVDNLLYKVQNPAGTDDTYFDQYSSNYQYPKAITRKAASNQFYVIYKNLNTSIATNTISSTGITSNAGVNVGDQSWYNNFTDFAYSDFNTQMIIIGKDGRIGSWAGGNALISDKSKTYIPYPFTQLAKPVGAVPQIIIAGENGTLTQYQTSGTKYKSLNTSFIQDLRHPHYYDNKVSCLKDGDTYLRTGLTATGLSTPFEFATPFPFNSMDINGTGKLYGVGDNGKYLYTSAGAFFTYSIGTVPITEDLRSVVFIPGTDDGFAVGTNGRIQRLMQANSMEILEKYTPSIAAMDFSDQLHGSIIIGDKLIKQTFDGGATWKTVTGISADVFESTLIDILQVDDNFALVIPSGLEKFIFKVENSFSTKYQFTIGTYSKRTIEAKVDDPYAIYVGCTLGKLLRNTINPLTHVLGTTSLITTPAPFNINGIHAFQDGRIAVVGDDGNNKIYNNNSWSTLLNGITTTNHLRDVYFRDYYNGYVVGDKATVYRTEDVEYIGPPPSAYDLHWQSRSVLGDGVISANTHANILKFAMFTDYNIMIGGKYAGGFSNTSIYPYARLITDESEMHSSRFFYDKVGRLTLSQNTRQFDETPPQFSYTLYDGLGRITEAGQVDNAHPSNNFASIFGDDVGGTFSPSVINDLDFNNFISNNTRSEVTQTFYDEPSTFVSFPATFSQSNLRNRVASVFYEDVYTPSVSTYDNAVHYDYDIHGNVQAMLTDMPENGITPLDQRYKLMRYEYDLISGNVLEVAYQPGSSDQFYHRYGYDEDNRITDVSTSTEGVVWQQDAKYIYYHHGPLARVELGEELVQGIDYVYTLQGWLKGINSNTLNTTRDPGKDGKQGGGNPNAVFAKDAYGLSLGYFAGDYVPITSAIWTQANRFEAKADNSQLLASTHNLYNGNIATMTSALYDSNNAAKTYGNAFVYDQLNRLANAKTFTNINTSTNAWNTGTTYNGMFQNDFKYDASGNILTQLRKNNAGATIDDLTYQYKRATNGQLLQNRLYHVNDVITASTFNDDIDNMGAFTSDPLTIETANNYAYDALGQLTKDEQENIAEIQWRNDGKIASILRGSAGTEQSLVFAYNPFGERISKRVLDGNGVWEETTYYIRDAQGNVMATYLNKNLGGSESYEVTERYIYGSSRLGVFKEPVSMLAPPSTPSFYYNRPGYRQYELSNHLGNVTTTLTAQKVPLHSGTTITGYTPQIINSFDYSPFGVTRLAFDVTQRVSGTLGVDGYRYGFQGQEKDDEIKGAGNSINYKYRMHDPRIGRFFSVDPLFREYLHNSTYAFSENRVIASVELEGLEAHDLNGVTVFGPYSSTAEAANAAMAGEATIYKDLPVFEVIDYGYISLDQNQGDNMGILRSGRGEINDVALDFLNSSIIGALDNAIATYLSDEASIEDKAWATFDVGAAAATTGKGKAGRTANVQKSLSKGIPESQLGPSGKPKVHSPTFSTLKKAKDAAANNPKSNTAPVKHTSDKGQKTHFHSTRDGEKLKGKDNTHYTDGSSKKNPD